MMDAQQSASDQPEGEREVQVRRSPITRGVQSYRPGLPVPQFAFRQIALHFIVASSTPIGTDDEWTSVRQFAGQLLDFSDVGEVTGLSMKSGEFSVVMQLRGVSAISEDYMLTVAFLRLKATLEGADLLRNGFGQARPHWKAIKAGDFVADEGVF
jgi:hypothetical protein